MKIKSLQWVKPTHRPDQFLEVKDDQVQGVVGPDWAEDTLIMRLPNGKVGAPVPLSNWLIHSDFVGPLLLKLQPAIVVEVGVFQGGSLLCMRAWCKYYRIPCQFFGFDTWDFSSAEMTEGTVDGDRIYRLLQRRTDRYGNIHLYRLESEIGSTLIPDATVDLLHIDASHYEGMLRRDLDLWLPKLAPRGVVLLHDVGMVSEKHQVWKVWKDIAREYPTYVDTRAFGLGAFCPKGVPPVLGDLFRQAIVV